jgi:hypothetical protein
MAEGLLRQIAGERFEVASAGVSPTQVRSEAIQVMQEIGIDISAQRSKSVDVLLGRHLITSLLCATTRMNSVQYFPAKLYEYTGPLKIRRSSKATMTPSSLSFVGCVTRYATAWVCLLMALRNNSIHCKDQKGGQGISRDSRCWVIYNFKGRRCFRGVICPSR